MNIEVGKYILRSDAYSMWIEEKFEVEEGKHKGEVRTRRVAGYCTSIDKLIKDFSERVLRSSDAEDLEGVLDALSKAQHACEALLMKAVKEGAVK